MKSCSSLRIFFVVALLVLAAHLQSFAQDGTVAGQLETQSVASDLQGTTPPATPPASVPAPAATNAAPASAAPAPAQITKPPPVGAPEVEQATGHRIRKGPVLVALENMSEFRFFYSSGFVLFNLLILLSVSNTAARRIFGTFCVIGLLFLCHYLFMGVSLPPLRPNDWEGPINRGFGVRIIREWKRVPDIGTSLFVLQEKNFLGPKNGMPLNTFFGNVITEQLVGKEAPVEYGTGFVTHGIHWLTASALSKDGRQFYFWCAEFKQQRIVVILSVAPSESGDKTDLQEIAALVGKIK